jgi:DNA-binding winged helix-turn-helix (wHTH) protein
MAGPSTRFGPFLIDRVGYRVLRGGQPVDLTPKLLDLLIHLVDHAGTLVTKEALLDSLWPGANVTDNALAQAVSELRLALGDNAKSPRYIRTIARRGYRFVAEVEAVDAARPAGAGLAATPASGARDTASLEAYRAFTEGSLRLETLDIREMPAAIRDFERAVAADPRYAPAHAGLASAELVLFETTRAGNEPAAERLARAIEHARGAVALDDSHAEAHATLALVLVSASEMPEAAAEARRAVSIDPANWRHLFRLCYATWGEERLRAASRMLDAFPDFAFAHFQIAMVHVARGRLTDAETVLRQGAAVQDRQIGRGGRFPALGLHWLLGLVRLTLDDVDEALAEFDREEALAEPHRLYGREYAMSARYGRAWACLKAKRVRDAIVWFERSLELYPQHAQSELGLSIAHGLAGSVKEAGAARTRAEQALMVLRRSRPLEAATVQAELLLADGRLSEAAAALDTLVRDAPPGFACWMLPVEPLLMQLAVSQSFTAAFQRLASRAV